MRVEIGNEDQPWARDLLPYLNGEPAHHCVFADDEAGIVRCFAVKWFPEFGRSMVYAETALDGTRYPPIIERTGKVELKRRPDIDHPSIAHLPVGSPAEWDAHYKLVMKRPPDA